jgi:hypothetical protein
MLQMLAFDPTHRISAEAALKIISRSAQPPPASHTQRAASPPPAACNRVREEDDGGGDGDFWKLESIFGVSGLRSVSIDVCGTRCLFFFCIFCMRGTCCMCCMRALSLEQLTLVMQSYNLSSTRFLGNMKMFLRHTSSHITQGDAAPLHILED